jgi:hypothetical protein
MCIGPEEAAAAGIAEKALHSLDPNRAKSKKDRRAREKRCQELLAELTKFDTPPESSLPGFGVRPHLSYDNYLAIEIPEASMLQLGEKLVRGLTYLRVGRLIDHEHEIRIHVVREGAGDDVRALIHSTGSAVQRVPGLLIESAHLADSPEDSVWRITIWGRLVLFATVVPIESNERV